MNRTQKPGALRLLEAMEILRAPDPSGAAPYRALLACGFTPLDLKTYLAAHLRTRLAGRSVEISTGLYGDLAGTLERIGESTDLQIVFVAVEWADLDPRLGYRSLGSWLPPELPEILRAVQASLERLARAVESISIPVVISLPTLPPTPIFYELPEQMGVWQAQLTAALAGFSEKIAGRARILDPQAIDYASPMAQRFDPRSDLATGFPYQGPHAEALARLLCAVGVPHAPKKGLITDLDDTVWSGILGDDGVEGIAWDLDHRAQLHGLYQKTVASLAASGILTAVASKNDAALVEKALARPDFLIPPGTLHPVEANWGPKSESVKRILKAWNIAADAVVFVDDSPLELDEVARAHPGIETLLFPKNDPVAAVELLAGLRRRFAKTTISEEDLIRAASLQNRPPEATGSTAEEFLSQANAVITIDTANPPANDRPFDLVNKTNQFNLNGRRYSAAEWSAKLKVPGAFLLVVSYQDRYGPLGRIAVMAGWLEGTEAKVDTWVMSCRAFSRRIEHRSIEYVFESLGANAIRFDFQSTERNGPTQELFQSLMGEIPAGAFHLDRARFTAACPALHHRVEVLSHV